MDHAFTHAREFEQKGLLKGEIHDESPPRATAEMRKDRSRDAAAPRLLPPPPDADQTSTVSTADLGSTLNSELTILPEDASPSSKRSEAASPSCKPFSRSGRRSVLSVEDHISDVLENHDEVAALLPRALLQVCTNSRHRVCLQLLWSKPSMFETYALQMADLRRVPVSSIDDKRAILLAFNDISKSGCPLQRDRVDNVLVILFELEGWAAACRTFTASDVSGGSLGAYLRRVRKTAGPTRTLPAPPAAGPVAMCPPPNLPVPPPPDRSREDSVQGKVALQNTWTTPSVEDSIFEALHSQPGAEVLIPRALVEVAISPQSRSALALLRTDPSWFRNYIFKLLELRQPPQMTAVLDQDAKLESYFEELAVDRPGFCRKLDEIWRATVRCCWLTWSLHADRCCLPMSASEEDARQELATLGIRVSPSQNASSAPSSAMSNSKLALAGSQRSKYAREHSAQLKCLGPAASILTQGLLSHLLCDCISSWWRGAIDGRTCCKLLTTKLASTGISHPTGVALVCMVRCGQERAATQAYRTLGVVLSVPHGDVRDAYLKLVQQYHPAAKHGNIDSFIKVNVAYEVIRADRLTYASRSKR